MNYGTVVQEYNLQTSLGRPGISTFFSFVLGSQSLLAKSKELASVRYPMRELELNYPMTKGKVYSEYLAWYDRKGSRAEEEEEAQNKQLKGNVVFSQFFVFFFSA
jgi:hypothetical protein